MTSLTATTILSGHLENIPYWPSPDGSIALNFQAQSGLYQFSVIADASKFDWEELYITLNEFNNTNQRTGPWDFSLLNKNAPLIPSYWVEVDQRRVGLWFFQRVSLEDIQAKRFRGNMAFHLATPGPHTLRLIPYRPMTLSWLSATLETDPEDHLAPLSWNPATWSQKCPATAWANPSFWQDLSTKLATTHARYQPALEMAFAWIRKKGDTVQGEGVGALMDYLRRPLHPEDILPLLMLHYLNKDPNALAGALRAVDAAIDLPHWGNPKEDGYSHNGDMGAAAMLRALSWAWHSLRDHLGDERRERLRAKLALQGKKFFELALLNRDYWGGSLVQDHGHKSLFAFGTASLNLLGIIPEAELWASFAIPRIQRGLQALPRDGAIPQSSYFQLFAYMDEPSFYRDTLLALRGEDIFDQAPLHSIVDYLEDVVREKDHLMIVAPAGVLSFSGGNLFLNQMATKYRDGHAAYMENVALTTPVYNFYHGVQEHGYFHGAIWGLLSYDPSIKPTPNQSPIQPIRRYEDSALAHYRDLKSDITLSMHSGPISGYNAYRRARGPCDRLEMQMGPGHFIVARGQKLLLVTPDGGYRLKTATRSCLLVDGQGPYGDIGYPMSISAFRHPGDEITSTNWDPATGKGSIRLDLTPAWPDSVGLAQYTRNFAVEEGKQIICRDQIVFSQPHLLEWRFQTMMTLEVKPEGPLAFQIGGSDGIRLAAHPGSLKLDACTAPTEVVYSYSSSTGFAKFQHVKYSTVEPVTTATIDFVISWPE